jgi:hypothetical protein
MRVRVWPPAAAKALRDTFRSQGLVSLLDEPGLSRSTIPAQRATAKRGWRSQARSANGRRSSRKAMPGSSITAIEYRSCDAARFNLDLAPAVTYPMSRFVGSATVRRRCLDQEGRPGGRSLALRISNFYPRSSITLVALNAAKRGPGCPPWASPAVGLSCVSGIAAAGIQFVIFHTRRRHDG